MRALVTTTINPPTNALLAFAEFVTCNTDWVFIIVGDTRTPHDDYHSLAAGNKRFVYLDPDKQADLLPKLSDIIGWRSIQRRNLGFICAYHLGAEWWQQWMMTTCRWKDGVATSLLGKMLNTTHTETNR